MIAAKEQAVNVQINESVSCGIRMLVADPGSLYAVHFPATTHHPECWRIVVRLGFPQAEVATEDDARAWLELLATNMP